MSDEAGPSVDTQAVEPPLEAGAARPRRSRPRGWLLGAALALVGALVLGAGAGGWWAANSLLVASHGDAVTTPTSAPDAGVVAELQMPDVRGLDIATARQVLADSGIPVSAITTHDAASVASRGIVVEQDPAFGATDLAKVDLGVAVPVTMPNLAGKGEDEAVQILSGFGTGADITYAYSKDAVPGTVMSAVPDVGAPLGQTASIVIATVGSTLPLTQLHPIAGGCRSESNVAINGRDHTTALACATSSDGAADTTWMLSKTVDRFTASVGISDDGTPGASVSFRVLVDGRSVAEGTAQYGASTEIDIPTTGGIQLTVRVGKTRDAVDVTFGDAVVYGSDEGIARLAGLR